MNTKIKIEIDRDYYSTLSYDFWNDDIRYILEQLDLHCEISNNHLINIVNDLNKNKTYKDDYNTKTIVNATGYCQSDWQTYKLYYNKDIDSDLLSQLIKLLERSFTHQNDYIVTKKEVIIIKGKEYETIEDYTSFCINHIEFPEDDDIIKEYIAIYGKDYNEYVINNN
jgi:hypothetical protein